MSLSRASVVVVMIAIAIPEIPRVARLVRSVVLTIREQTYVEAATTLGARLPRIMLRYILPNVMAPLIVQATYVCASAVLLEAYLSFLGVGTPPSARELGQHNRRRAAVRADRAMADHLSRRRCSPPWSFRSISSATGCATLSILVWRGAL